MSHKRQAQKKKVDKYFNIAKIVFIFGILIMLIEIFYNNILGIFVSFISTFVLYFVFLVKAVAALAYMPVR